MIRDEPRMLAAPAPELADDDLADVDLHDTTPLPGGERVDLEIFCWQWAAWLRSRRLYVKPSLPPSLLGRLRSRGTGRAHPNGGPDAACSAQFMAFYIAFAGQPDALDRQVFVAHYLERPRYIKVAADHFAVSRRHWYRLVKDFRERVYAASLPILQHNLDAARRLPSLR